MRTFYPSQFYSLQICHGACRAIEHEEKLSLPSCFQAWAPATAKTQALQATFVWDFAKEVEGQTFQKGDKIKSQKFSLLGVPDLQMSLYPQGHTFAQGGYMSLYLNAPEGWQIKFKATCGDEVHLYTFDDEGWGWLNFAPISDKTTKIAIELLEAVSPETNA